MGESMMNDPEFIIQRLSDKLLDRDLTLKYVLNRMIRMNVRLKKCLSLKRDNMTIFEITHELDRLEEEILQNKEYTNLILKPPTYRANHLRITSEDIDLSSLDPIAKTVDEVQNG